MPPELEVLEALEEDDELELVLVELALVDVLLELELVDVLVELVLVDVDEVEVDELVLTDVDVEDVAPPMPLDVELVAPPVPEPPLPPNPPSVLVMLWQAGFVLPVGGQHAS